MGEIVRQLGPLTYIVDVMQDRLWKRLMDHVKDIVVLPQENETVPQPSVDLE